MERFFTKIDRPKYPFYISYKDNIFFLGSCFSDSIGGVFFDRKFKSKINPFGTIFNPYSIFYILDMILNKKEFEEEDWIYFNEKWINLQLHSQCSYQTLGEAKEDLRIKILDSYNFIKETDFLFITLGTSWTYVHNNTNKIVGNCHKIPQGEFTKVLLSPDDIYLRGHDTLNMLKEINNNIKIIFTVSPVRYLSYGSFGNSVSKSNIFVSINRWLEKLDNAFYFPAYEIFMDELRDYRFYSEDLVHPNDLGIKYVWEFMSDVFFDETTKGDIRNIEKIIKSKKHIIKNNNTKEYSIFLENINNKISSIQKKYPFIHF